MRKGLKIKEFIVERDRKLTGVYEEETGQVYFSLQALAKTAGYTPQQAKDFKKSVINNNTLRNLIEFREIPTFESGQKGWVVYLDMLPNFLLLFPKLRILSKAFASNNVNIENVTQKALEDLDSVFPSLNKVKKIYLYNEENSNELVHIREFKPRVSIKVLAEFFSISEKSIMDLINISIEQFGKIDYDSIHKDLTLEGLILLNSSNFFSNKNMHILLKSFTSAQDFLVSQLYTNIVRELSTNLSQVYIIENPLTGLIKIGISARLEKRVKELSGGGQTQLFIVYSSKLISNAQDIKDSIMEDLKDYKKFGEWFNVSLSEVLKVAKKHEKNMYVEKPTF